MASVVTRKSGEAEMNCDGGRQIGPQVDDVAEDRGEWRLRENCGVFGAVATDLWPQEDNLSTAAYMALTAIQHRGQESAGLVASDDGLVQFREQRGAGLVSHVFDATSLQRLAGRQVLGHTRYSTSGAGGGGQPYVVHTRHGQMALAHNGQLVNAEQLRAEVLRHGVGLSTSCDSELLVQLLALEPPCGEPHGADWPARLRHVMDRTPAAYSLGVLFGDAVYGARDPFGNRPLCVGYLPAPTTSGEPSLENGEGAAALAYLLSSESCAIQTLGGRWLRDVRPGEIVKLSRTGVHSLDIVQRPASAPYPALCIFEYVYFARADSWIEGQMVYSVRERCGEQLAREAPVQADIVSTVPESATPAAIGYARQAGLPYVEVFHKNRYVGRTFIQPSQAARQLSVSKKFGVLSANVQGRRVVIVDDSIVRGTTIGPIVRLLRQHGASEVHIRVASPAIQHPCYMGINIPTRAELFANRHLQHERSKAAHADSLHYLSVQGLRMAVCQDRPSQSSQSRYQGHCVACLSGEYPVSMDW